MRVKIILTSVVMLLFCSNVWGQKFVGPKKAEPKTLVKLKIEGEVGKDPQIVCIPENEDYEIVKNLKDELVIIFVPQQSKDYTFILASNKAEKTVLLLHSIIIGTPTPPPDPVNNPYFNDLKGAYLVSPDKASLNVLIEIYTQVGTTKFNNGTEASQALKTVTDNRLPKTSLRTVRDQVATIMAKDVASTTDTFWNQNQFELVFKNIIAALKLL